MPNVRSITTVMELVRTRLNADTTLADYLKAVYIHQNEFWTKVPNVASPCIVLNDNGEPLTDIANSRNADKRVVRRFHNIEITCLVRYPKAEVVLIGSNDTENVNSIGIIDFSHLVEAALNADKMLQTAGVPAVDTLTYPGWQNIEIEQDKLFMVGRQTVLSYKGFQEAL